MGGTGGEAVSEIIQSIQTYNCKHLILVYNYYTYKLTIQRKIVNSS